MWEAAGDIMGQCGPQSHTEVGSEPRLPPPVQRCGASSATCVPRLCDLDGHPTPGLRADYIRYRGEQRGCSTRQTLGKWQVLLYVRPHGGRTKI